MDDFLKGASNVSQSLSKQQYFHKQGWKDSNLGRKEIIYKGTKSEISTMPLEKGTCGYCQIITKMDKSVWEELGRIPRSQRQFNCHSEKPSLTT